MLQVHSLSISITTNKLLYSWAAFIHICPILEIKHYPIRLLIIVCHKPTLPSSSIVEGTHKHTVAQTNKMEWSLAQLFNTKWNWCTHSGTMSTMSRTLLMISNSLLTTKLFVSRYWNILECYGMMKCTWVLWMLTNEIVLNTNWNWHRPSSTISTRSRTLALNICKWPRNTLGHSTGSAPDPSSGPNAI